MAEFSGETLKAKRVCNDIFQSMKENNCFLRLLYLAKPSLIIEKEKLSL